MLGSTDRTLESISMRRLFASATILAIFLTSFASSPAHAAVRLCNGPGEGGLTISGTTVSTIASNCTSVVIPDGILSISEEAYDGGALLTSLTLPNSLTRIEAYAFVEASSLTTLTLPNSLTFIGESAFNDASSLTTLTLSNSLTRIEYEAFSGATSLTNLTLPNSLTYIGEYAFADLTSLTSLSIPNSVTTVEDSAFRGATNLTSLTIGTGLSQIGQTAFLNATALTSVIIPNNITRINVATFKGASSLANVTIGSGVNTIEYRAFQNATSLSRVTFLGAAPAVTIDLVDDVEINNAFLGVSAGAKAIVTSANAASFGGAGSNWNGLLVELSASDAPPADDNAAAARAAAELRETKKRKARADLTNPAIALTVGAFSDAECNGVHGVNFAEVSAEIQSLSLDSRIDIKEILKICRKYEVVDKVATSKPFHHAMLQEIGLIPLDSKFKSQITVALRSLPGAEVSTYKQIEIAIANKVKAIQDLKSRLAATIARISGR